LGKRLRKIFGDFKSTALSELQDAAQVNTQTFIQRQIIEILNDIQKRNVDEVILHGYKVYSQCDEDGIINEIFSRIGSKSKLFVEIGCGNGLENNTHFLLLKGWRGVWIDASEKNINFIKRQLGYKENNRLEVVCSFITKDNVNKVLYDSLKRFAPVEDKPLIDFLSLDIDGNDLEVFKHIECIRPRVVCVEYNSKFPPPAEIEITYNAFHQWQYDDYQGASLQTFVNYFDRIGYSLVSCSVSGVNAFFVKKSEMNSKINVSSISDIYQPPRYHLIYLASGHSATLKYLKNIIHAGDR